MDRDELIFSEYKLYSEQKENFIERNFKTNRFYMASVFVLIVALIYTGNVIFLNKISATLVFALLGVSVSALWWMNVDSYNTPFNLDTMTRTLLNKFITNGVSSLTQTAKKNKAITTAISF